MKNILLIGTGRFGRHIAVQLSQLGHQVMAVDTNEERISDVLPYVTKDVYKRQVKHADLLLSVSLLLFEAKGPDFFLPKTPLDNS